MNVKKTIRAAVAVGSVTVIVALLFVGCGGSDATPTPTAAPPATSRPAVASPTAAAAATARPATPAASPLPSPRASASPRAGGASASSITREEFDRQLLQQQQYPITPAAHTGGTVILGESSDISTVNGILSKDELTLTITGAIYEGLIGISPLDGQPVPGLADSWDVSADGLTYTFHLNRKATWHDGVDFTADDVKFSFDAVLDPNTGSIATSTVNEAVKSYRVVDPDTFEITARDRLVSFLYDAPGSVLIMPKHIWDKIGTESWTFDGGSTGKDASRVIGTGPFKFKEWVQGDHATVVRNDAYYDIPPTIAALTLQVQPNADAAVLALQNKATDIMQIIPPAQTQAVKNTPGLDVKTYDFYTFTVYAFNLDPAKTPLFQDKEVRQALFYALDRDSITKNIFLGYGQAAVGTQPKLSPAYAPDRMTPAYVFDPEKAKQLLAQAGWTDRNGDGTVDKDGRELKFKLLYASGESTVDQIVAYMQEAWSKIGVKMEIEQVNFNALIDRLDRHDFDMTLLAFNLSPDGSQTSLFGCSAYRGGINFMKFCDQRWDDLDQQQKREFDPAKRKELLIQQSQIIWEQQPVGVIRFGIARTGYNTRLHNFYPNGYGFLWSLPFVWVDG